MANGLALPIQPPRPAFCSLPAAIKAAIAHGNSIGDLNLARWAETYSPATTEDIRNEWERQLSEASLHPNNSFEIPEGK